MMTPGDLTDRQREVAALVADGVTNKRIAGQLRISTRRVRIIISSVAFRIGADPEKDERIAIAVWWVEHRIHRSAA